MNPSSQFEARNRRTHAGKSCTSNFLQWSQGGKVASSDQHHHQVGGQGYSPVSPVFQSYQQYQTPPQQLPQGYQPHQQPQLQGYQQQQQPLQQQYQYYQQSTNQQQPQQYQHLPASNPTTNPAPYGFRQQPHHQVTSEKSSTADINAVKSKIIEARVRNLALKRAIVQRSLQSSGNGELNTVSRTQSASSSRSDLATSSSDAAGSDMPLPDAISDLEDQLKKLKSEVGHNDSRSTLQHQEEETKDLKKHRKEKFKKSHSKFKEGHGGKSRRESKDESQSASPVVPSHPDVPLLSLDNNTKSAIDHQADSEAEKDGELEQEEVTERPMKKKKKQSKQRKMDAEKLAKEDEALTNSLDKIMGEVSSEIESNDAILEKDKKRVVSSRVEGGLNAPLDSYRMKELRRNEERKKRAEARDKIDSLLNNEKLEFKIPRWKHELNGNMNPKPELVLKGKSLFRMAAYLVMYFYAKPIVRVRIMRIMGRDHLKEDLTKATLLALDTCASWLTTAAKVPITSIVQDQTLNLSGLQQKDLMSKKGFHQQCNLQLKVRVTAMVKGITKIDIDDVPPHIKSFLEKLISDGNFFRSDFLYSFESSALEFDKLGASNNVTRHLSNEDLLERARERLAPREEEAVEHHHSDADEVVAVGENTYEMGTAKMLIRNFLFLRVFVTNILLSPWDYGVGPKPAPKQKKITDNLRMAASVFYAMLRVYQPAMLQISHGNRRKTIQRMKVGQFGGQGGFMLGPDTTPLDARRASSSDLNNKTVIKSQQSTVSNGGEEDEDLKEGDSTVEKTEKMDVKTNEKKKLPDWLMSFADKVLGEAQALNITEADDATSFLLRNRPPFDNDLEHLHVFLFGDQQLEHAKSLIDPWMADLAKQLDTWISSLTRKVIKDMKVKYQQEHDI